MSTTVLLADDHQIIREGLRMLLESQEHLRVIGEAEDGRSAVQLTQELQPDIVLIDISMPVLDGIEATRQIMTDLPECKVIALSVHREKRYIIEILKAGAAGYLLKDAAFSELVVAIETVMAHKLYLSSPITKIVVDDYLSIVPCESPSLVLLTDKEREVLRLLAEGNSSKQIATDMTLNINTVSLYRQQMMEKLNLHSVAELTKYAIRVGVISC